LRFEPTPYETFDESTDLYGDGSVVVVPLRGHTPGSVGIFLNLAPTLRLFYVGDAVDEERGFEERVGKSLILRDSDNDMALANQIVGKLSELHEKVPELAIVPAHGRSAYKKFFPSGPLSCVSGPIAASKRETRSSEAGPRNRGEVHTHKMRLADGGLGLFSGLYADEATVAAPVFELHDARN